MNLTLRNKHLMLCRAQQCDAKMINKTCHQPPNLNIIYTSFHLSKKKLGKIAWSSYSTEVYASELILLSIKIIQDSGFRLDRNVLLHVDRNIARDEMRLSSPLLTPYLSVTELHRKLRIYPCASLQKTALKQQVNNMN